MSLFYASLLNNEIALEIAIGVLEGHAHSSAASIECIVEDLCGTQNLLEFMLSGKSPF